MRLLQGMLVAHYQGTGKSNALEVFCIPETEHDSFFKWLKEYDATMFRKMKHTSGFVPLGNRKTLTTLTTQYRLSHTQTNVGWKTVPMQPNSVVFWVGPHRVRHARGKTDTDSYRSVLYLNIQDTPLCDELPSTPYDECFANHTQGKQVNRSLETALKDYMAKYGQLYGWNKQTIPSAFHNLFEAPFGETNHTKRDQQHEDTPIADPCTEHPHRSCQQGPRCAEALSTVPAGARDGQEGGEEAAQGARAQRQGPRLRAPSPARSDLVGGRARAPRLTSRSYLRAYSLMTPHDNHV